MAHIAQMISLTIVLLGNFISGVIPFFFLKARYGNQSDRCARNKTLAFLIYFGGGVFMSTCFLYLQPSANQEYEKHYHAPCLKQQLNSDEDTHQESLSIPELITLCSFFSMFIIEEILQFILNGYPRKTSGIQRKITFCSCAKRHTECSRTFKACHAAEQTLYGLKNNSGSEDDIPEIIRQRTSDAAANTESKLLQASISQQVLNYGTMADITGMNTSPVPIIAPILYDKDGKVSVVKPPPKQVQYTPFTTYLLLALTLSVYNIYQGISLGYLTDNFTWVNLIACIQQYIISFVAGSTISQDSENPLSVICFIGLLSLMCPLGISVKMIFSNALDKVSHLDKAIINAILCGEFLYLTFFDFLRGNILHNAPSLGKFASFTLGFIIVTSLKYVSVIT